MERIDEVKAMIEKTRKELDELIVTDKTEAYYEKSKEMDQLVAEFIELDKMAETEE